MTDDSLDGLEDANAGVGTISKKGKAGGFFSNILKWVLIGIAVIVLVVTVVLITMKVVLKNQTGTQAETNISDNYLQKRDILDWYKSLGAIKTRTSDEEAASVVIDIALGYKKDDKKCSAEITQRTVELKDFLRNYFAQKSKTQLRPQDENKLKIEIRNAINDNILSDSKIKDVSFQQFDVISQ